MQKLVKLERLIQDINVNDFYGDVSVRRWNIGFVHALTIHKHSSVGRRLGDPSNHECKFDLLSSDDEVFVMLDHLKATRGGVKELIRWPTSPTRSTELL